MGTFSKHTSPEHTSRPYEFALVEIETVARTAKIESFEIEIDRIQLIKRI